MEAVRSATRGDGDRCAELCASAMAEIQEARGGPLYARRESRLVSTALLRPGGLDRLLADDRRVVRLGTIDEAVVGFALGRIEPVGEATLGVIEACYVEPEARGVGVGRALLDALTGWFEAAGCGGVDAPTLPGDRATKNALEAAGFKGRLITMHRALG